MCFAEAHSFSEPSAETQAMLPVLGQLPGEISCYMAQCNVHDAAESSELEL